MPKKIKKIGNPEVSKLLKIRKSILLWLRSDKKLI